ncbi:f-box domain cyclin [Fusarium albosuccineum]|uniref:F-box domain cyclin n=1 Tax=Fusarium albosuccineum TaxID=1237068 RepID=A0A8H4L022_9HYPO|nr:f-box domain cyclin [Fusarium albosuccineum]
MGFSSVYCVICGCPFDIPPRDDGLDDDNNWSSDDPLEDETKQSQPTPTKHNSVEFDMPKNETAVVNLFVSEPADWAITDGFYFRLGGVEYRVLTTANQSDDVLFPLHESCLSILQHVLAWRAELSPETESTPSLATVYKNLCAQFSRNVAEKRRITKDTGFSGSTDYMDYGLEFNHEYLGAREFWVSEGWEPTKANEWYCNDPIDIPDLADFITKLLARMSSEHRIDATGSNADICSSTIQTAPSPCLEGLPTEILDLIVNCLVTPSVMHLRQSSKTMASSIELDQSFWHKKLLQGSAIPYLWDLGNVDKYLKSLNFEADEESRRFVKSGSENWRGLAQKLAQKDNIIKMEASVPSMPWGLRNRCRIWALANRLTTPSAD